MLKINQNKPFHYEWPHVIEWFWKQIIDLSGNTHTTITSLLLLLGQMKEPIKNIYPDST